MTTKTMNAAAYARTHGSSRQAISKWRERGLLVYAGRKIDVAASDALMEAAGMGRFRIDAHGGRRQANVRGAIDRPGAGLVGGQPTAALAIGEDETPAEAAERLVKEAGVLSIGDALAMKETYHAYLKRLEFDTKVGLVVSLASVAAVYDAETAMLRTKLLAIPSSIAPILSRKKTVVEIESTVRDFIHEVLEDMSSTPPKNWSNHGK